MLKHIILAVFAMLALVLSPHNAMAGSATEGIVVYNPIDGVTIVTVSTDIEQEAAVAGGPVVNVSNQIAVVTIIADRRFSRRCGIGVPYPWQRVHCGDPLYPFWDY